MALRRLILQVIVFTAAGWLVAVVARAAGGYRWSSTLFVVGIGLALVAGLLALEASDLPVGLRFRSRAGVFAFTGEDESQGLQLPASRAFALSVVSAVGLLIAAFLI